MSGTPTNVVSQNGVAAILDTNLNVYVQGCQTASQARSFVGIVGMTIALQGLTAPGDGGTGDFYWNPGTGFVDDGVNVIVPSAVAGASGAWVRLTPSPTIVMVSFGGGLTAAGNNQATAFQIETITSQFTSVGSGTGAILPPPPNLGVAYPVINDGANAMIVYPPVGSTFIVGGVALTVNEGVTIKPGNDATFFPVTTTTWSVH